MHEIRACTGDAGIYRGFQRALRTNKGVWSLRVKMGTTVTQDKAFTKLKKVGRPTKLTPEVQATIIAYIRQGNYVETSAAAAGVHKDTFYRWLKAGGRAKSGIYKQFSDAVNRAVAKAVHNDLQVIDKAANGYDV